MAGAPERYLPPSAVNVELHGLEQFYAMPGCQYIIADTYHLRLAGGARDALLAHGPEAARQVALRHPRMRAWVDRRPGGRKLFVVRPSVDDAQRLWSVHRGEEWKRVVHDLTNARVSEDRFNPDACLVSLHLVLPPVPGGLVAAAAAAAAAEAGTAVAAAAAAAGAGGAGEPEAGCVAQLVVRADHCAADGFSCSRIAHDFLSAVASLAAAAAASSSAVPDHAAAGGPGGAAPAAAAGDAAPAASAAAAAALFAPLPALPSAMRLLLGRPNLPLRVLAPLLMYAASRGVIRNYVTYPPVLPLHPEMPRLAPGRPPPITPSFSLFATGSPAALAATRARCREERVTVMGAIVGAVAAAFRELGRRPPAARSPCASLLGGGGGGGGEARVALSLDVDVNLRHRLPVPLGDDHVGCLIGFFTLPALAPSGAGVRLSERFWDVARRMKASIDDNAMGFEARLAHAYLDAHYRAFDKVGHTPARPPARPAPNPRPYAKASP
jgi:hypothetical protein